MPAACPAKQGFSLRREWRKRHDDLFRALFPTCRDACKTSRQLPWRRLSGKERTMKPLQSIERIERRSYGFIESQSA